MYIKIEILRHDVNGVYPGSASSISTCQYPLLAFETKNVAYLPKESIHLYVHGIAHTSRFVTNSTRF